MPQIDLSSDEALVLFELCSRFIDSDAESVPLAHAADRVALWGLTCALERVLSEPLRSDYSTLLAAARERLASEGPDSGPTAT